MTRNILIGVLLILILIIGGVLIFYDGSGDGNEGAETILYYGEGCGHCATVSEFIDTNNIKSKVEFVEKEIFGNKENNDEMKQKAVDCGLDPNQIGVPFLYDNGECFIGDKDVIEFFQSK